MARGGQVAQKPDCSHLCHLKDALRIQAASSHLPRAGDRALVRDGNDEARHRAGLLLQSRVHHVSVSHLLSERQPLSTVVCVRTVLTSDGRLLAHLAQGHYTGNVLYIESQTVIRVIRQLDLLSSFVICWYVNSWNSVGEAITTLFYTLNSLGDYINNTVMQWAHRNPQLTACGMWRIHLKYSLCVKESCFDGDWDGIIQISITLEELWEEATVWNLFWLDFYHWQAEIITISFLIIQVETDTSS